MNDVLCVVVTYNRLCLLKECLAALKKCKGKFDLIVINNSSTDGTKEYLKNNNYKVINLDQNIGGAGGFYTGLKYSCNNGYEYSWLMDDDTIVHENTFNELQSAIDSLEGRFGFLCSAAYWKDNNPCVMNIPRIEFRSPSTDYKNSENGLLRCLRASFVSILISNKSVYDVGLPIKEFFIWGDDTEYTERISNRFNSYFVARSIVTHEMDNNLPTSIAIDKSERISRYYYLFRNRVYISRKKGCKEFIINTCFNIYQIVKILFAKSNKKGKRIHVLLKGWISGLFFNPNIEYIKIDKKQYEV